MKGLRPEGLRGALSVLFCLMLAFPAGCTRRPCGPNILFITLDTTRADHLGCYGCESDLTPALDQLAAKGTTFDRACTCIPVTLPSHISMLTGLYPPQHGIRLNAAGRMSDSIPWLPEILSAAGYETSAFVATDILSGKYGIDRGFDVFDEPELESVQDAAVMVWAGQDWAVAEYRPAGEVTDAVLCYLREWTARGRQRRPFFCWAHYYDPHKPRHEHKEAFGERFSGHPYHAEVAFMDQHIGRLLDGLSDCGLTGNTLIVVAGDHGEGLGDHDEDTHGCMLYDSTLRVPLLFSLPGIVRTGHRVHEFVRTIDIFPTVLELAGIDWRSYDPHVDDKGSLPPDLDVFRRSLAPALRGEPIADGALYSETDLPFQMMGWSPLRSFATAQWKYIRAPRSELYHTPADPLELNDLSGRQQDELEHAKALLRATESSMIPAGALPVALTAQESRRLASLGYMAGAYTSPDEGIHADLPDIKDTTRALRQASLVADMGQRGVRGPELVSACRQLVAIDARTAIFHFWLGVALHLDDQPELARMSVVRSIDMFESMRKRYGENDGMRDSLAGAYDRLGLIEAQLDNPAEAERAFEQAVAVDPFSARACHNLGVLHLRHGRRDKAVHWLTRALELDPDYGLARANLRKAQKMPSPPP